MFDQDTLAAIEDIAAKIKVEPAALRAVAQEESGGQAFAMVNGKKMPLIRWEGHYFYQRLKGDARDEAVRLGLASPKAGKVKNPKAQAARWKIVEKAIRIDRRAALESFSIGVGQVMTAHWKALGYASAGEMITAARASVAGQILVMVQYIQKFGLVDELQRKDFTAFARGYNGAGFRKHGYHTRIAAAYAKFSGQPAVSKATGMLRMGSKGARVRSLQALLVRAGYAVKVDGDYGPTTKKAVMAFQKLKKLTADGVAGPETIRALDGYRVAPEEPVGQQKPSDVQEVKDATKGGGMIVAVVALRDQIAETASYLTGLEAETAQTVANALLAGSGAIGVGLAAWGLYGWWKSRQTDEGDVGQVTAEMGDTLDPVLA